MGWHCCCDSMDFNGLSWAEQFWFLEDKQRTHLWIPGLLMYGHFHTAAHRITNKQKSLHLVPTEQPHCLLREGKGQWMTSIFVSFTLLSSWSESPLGTWADGIIIFTCSTQQLTQMFSTNVALQNSPCCCREKLRLLNRERLCMLLEHQGRHWLRPW